MKILSLPAVLSLLTPLAFADVPDRAFADPTAAVEGILNIERPPRADVVIYNQLTAAGRARYTPPAADRPQSYILANHGIQELGPRYRSNRRITEDLVTNMVVEGLAQSHYVPAAEGDTHLDLAISCYVGVITRDVVQMGGTVAGDSRMIAGGEAPPAAGLDPDLDLSEAILDNMTASAELNAQEFIRNFEDLQALVGGASLFRMSHLDPKRQRFMREANSDRFFVILMAYDGAEVVAGEENPTLLWIARMSVATAGTTMREAIPAMVVAGQDFFGRDTNTPAMVGFREGRPRVIIGEPEIVDVVDDE